MSSSSKTQKQKLFSFSVFGGFTPYISQEGADNLKQYKYAGGDSGILYKIFYNPLAINIVNHLPEHIAPNLITLTGFLFTVVPCILQFALFGLDFNGQIASWWCYMEAVCYLIYRILDEMDGKQARKTGNSSPLGLLFDHGCDAFTTALLTMMIMKMLQVGNSEMLMIGIISCTQSFYFATLEEYYTGGLYLGVGNGVTDGSALIIALFSFAGYMGNDIFTQQLQLSYEGIALDVPISHLVLYVIMASQIGAVLMNIVSLISHHRKQLTPEQIAHCEPLSYSKLCQQILSFYLTIVAIYVATQVSQYHILIQLPLLPVLLFSFIYAHNTIHIQVAHVTHTAFNPWTRVYIMNMIVLSFYSILSIQFKYVMKQYVVFGVLLGLTTFAQWQYIVCIIVEMTTILNIKVFKVKPKTPIADDTTKGEVPLLKENNENKKKESKQPKKQAKKQQANKNNNKKKAKTQFM